MTFIDITLNFKGPLIVFDLSKTISQDLLSKKRAHLALCLLQKRMILDDTFSVCVLEGDKNPVVAWLFLTTPLAGLEEAYQNVFSSFISMSAYSVFAKSCS